MEEVPPASSDRTRRAYGGGSYTGNTSFTNPAFVLFGRLWNLQYNGGDAGNYIDTAEVGLYSDGIGAEYVKYYENSHAELVADNAKGWGSFRLVEPR